MKRTLLAIAAALVMTSTMTAQRLTDITAEARFITDKMVVELGLSKVQRDNILSLNLAYLDGINSYRDINAHGWRYRNDRIRALLSAKQWKKFKKCHHFYRPIGWRDNAYVHNVYDRYPRKGRPTPPPPPPEFDRRMDKGPRPRPEYGKPGKPRFDNNSPEAIKMRREMRRGNRFAR